MTGNKLLIAYLTIDKNKAKDLLFKIFQYDENEEKLIRDGGNTIELKDSIYFWLNPKDPKYLLKLRGRIVDQVIVDTDLYYDIEFIVNTLNYVLERSCVPEKYQIMEDEDMIKWYF